MLTSLTMRVLNTCRAVVEDRVGDRAAVDEVGKAAAVVVVVVVAAVERAVRDVAAVQALVAHLRQMQGSGPRRKPSSTWPSTSTSGSASSSRAGEKVRAAGLLVERDAWPYQ